MQHLILYDLSSNEIVPKLFGAFETERIEEFAQRDPLPMNGLYITEVSEEVARVMARFYSMKLPISRKVPDLLKKLGWPNQDWLIGLLHWMKNCPISSSKLIWKNLQLFQSMKNSSGIKSQINNGQPYAKMI